MKIEFITNKSLFDVGAKGLVNPVNCVGVMGAGLALEFKKKFPKNYKDYVCFCKHGEYKPGIVFFTTENNIILYNVATKNHWKDRSQLEWVEKGIRNLVECLLVDKIESVAIPALGCGLGGLNWTKQVLPIFFRELQRLQYSDIIIYLFPAK